MDESLPCSTIVLKQFVPLVLDLLGLPVIRLQLRTPMFLFCVRMASENDPFKERVDTKQVDETRDALSVSWLETEQVRGDGSVKCRVWFAGKVDLEGNYGT